MKINTYLIIIVFCISLISCELDLTPYSEISEEDFYQTTEEVYEAVIGCYSGLLDPMIYEWIVTELRSDNTQMYPNNSISIYTEYREMDSYTCSSENTLIEAYWNACYHDIALANQVLENSDVVSDDSLKLQYESECRFIRAYHYFNLVRLYGPIPLVDETISGTEAKEMSRSSEESVYELIVSDLTTAADGLPDSYDTEDLGRATSWAAKTLLAKVYLTEGEYSTAATLLKDIIDNSPHYLLDDYSDIFDVTNEMNDEIIFAVRFMSGNVGLGAPFANYFAPRTSGDNVVNGDGYGYNYPTEDIMSLFDSADLRKDVCFQEGYYDSDNEMEVDDAYINKFMDDVDEAEDAENDWPVIRYADVLLLYAEALNELSGVTDALPYLNLIRDRAGLEDYTESDITSQYEFRLALEDERRLEFAFENRRYFDLMRTDRLLTVMNEHFETEEYYNDPDHTEFYVGSIEEWQLLLPIPQREIDINTNLTQNQGY